MNTIQHIDNYYQRLCEKGSSSSTVCLLIPDELPCVHIVPHLLLPHQGSYLVIAAGSTSNIFLKMKYFEGSSYYCVYRHVFKEEVTPVILYIEEKPEDQHDVHQADEYHDHHSAIHGHSHNLWFLHSACPASP